MHIMYYGYNKSWVSSQDYYLKVFFVCQFPVICQGQQVYKVNPVVTKIKRTETCLHNTISAPSESK